MSTIHTIGRRKTAIARAYLEKGKGKITINKQDYTEYFDTPGLQYKIVQAFQLTETEKEFDLKVNVNGGGITGQAEAVRLAIARGLNQHNPEHRTVLKANGLLTRDPRMVERKKPGQKKARKRFQFSKR
ncbi:MAG: 30S ribosomal protein S9 [Bacteroidia bacterium]|nr:30S ribosomal protein S9 [Bacteroidia bacterium]NNC85765.1 30S ribosomal protein S9 [Bacteroidia bacterium]NNM15703.1 30S ribosomal protein S9 [Bacteroidia bacterium]